MDSCDLCGRHEDLFYTLVEGVKLSVCSNCKSFGNVISPVVNREKIIKKTIVEPIELVVDNFNSIIKTARENLKLTQEELAHKLNERDSSISKIEQGHIKPNIELARKLEKFLNVKLVFKETVLETPKSQSKSSALTIGDMIGKFN
ncbi:MAG TPA: helix-turn-helix domain-containing protein [Candidatus Nanoarchaeia archaeon]|nr:helix-turn-helix domain-containing protein [Candidatus Nanoarchaeia archaeon]